MIDRVEIGMFTRNERGYIHKVGEEIKRMKIEPLRIKKASFNILDLIEIGDYVNGTKVYKAYSDEVWLENKDEYGNLWVEMIVLKDIKDVVMRERFEKIKYRVEG